MAKCTGIRCPMQYGYKVEECNRTECPYRTEPVTNADRIRSMNEEELIKLLTGFCAFACIFPDKDCEHGNCEECVKEWLSSQEE